MLNVAHSRKKRTYEMSSIKLFDQLKQSRLHPKDVYELFKIINIHSVSDVIALDNPDDKFFLIKLVCHSDIARELISVLHDRITYYNLNSLPAELRQPLLDAWDRRKTGRES